MGEAKRRKQLLGSKYGKPSSSNSQIEIFTRDQSSQETERLKLSRPPIPEVENMKSQLNSVELRDWLIEQWGSLVIFATPKDGCLIASELLGKLAAKFSQDLNSDSTISYSLSPSVKVSVGINVHSWTVWASVGDISQGCFCITSDVDEFKLA